MTDIIGETSMPEHGVVERSTRRFPFDLDYLPVGLFGSVMGLTGLAIAWRLAHDRYGIPAEIASVIGATAGSGIGSTVRSSGPDTCASAAEAFSGSDPLHAAVASTTAIVNVTAEQMRAAIANLPCEFPTL